MSDKELENMTIKIPDNVPISFLEKLTNFSQDMLMLASEPSASTETGYMSKYFTYGDLSARLCIDFNLGFLSSKIENCFDDKVDITSLVDKTIKCDIKKPYIISSISQDGGNITDLSGYRLYDGMRTVFSEEPDLKNIIPSLTSTTKDGGARTVLTSVTTENGQIASVGTMPINEIY